MTLTKNIRPLLATAILAATLAACGGGSQSKESTGEYWDDSMITTKVKTALIGDKDVSGTSVSVETFKGRVQLSGFVKSQAERRQAETVARGVTGVKDVVNNIQVR
jgi:osmotically-inducible protein OsmY